jgi:hypothetical protein
VALKLKAVGEVAYDKSQSQEAMQWIRSNPETFAHLVALRIFHFWFPMGLTLAHTALEWTLTILSFIGLYLLYFRHRAAALLILGVWLLYPPVYYIMLWSSRYRYPLNWTLILTAAVALEFAICAVTAPRSPLPRGAQ